MDMMAPMAEKVSQNILSLPTASSQTLCNLDRRPNRYISDNDNETTGTASSKVEYPMAEDKNLDEELLTQVAQLKQEFIESRRDNDRFGKKRRRLISDDDIFDDSYDELFKDPFQTSQEYLMPKETKKNTSESGVTTRILNVLDNLNANMPKPIL